MNCQTWSWTATVKTELSTKLDSSCWNWSWVSRAAEPLDLELNELLEMQPNCQSWAARDLRSESCGRIFTSWKLLLKNFNLKIGNSFWVQNYEVGCKHIFRITNCLQPRAFITTALNLCIQTLFFPCWRARTRPSVSVNTEFAKYSPHWYKYRHIDTNTK